MTPPSELDLLQEISQKLDQVIGLLAIQGKDRNAQLATLYALGYDSGQIAAIVGMSPGNVRRWKSQSTRRRSRRSPPQE